MELLQIGKTAFLGDCGRYAVKIMKEITKDDVRYYLYYIDTRHDRIENIIELNREILKILRTTITNAMLEGMRL